MLTPQSAGWRAFAIGYVLLVMGVAIGAQVTADTRYFLAALVLTLPLGVVAIVGVYVVFAVLQSVTLAAPFNVLLFVTAACGNVVLVTAQARGRRPEVPSAGTEADARR